MVDTRVLRPKYLWKEVIELFKNDVAEVRTNVPVAEEFWVPKIAQASALV